MLQAIDRLRLIHSPRRKTVYVLCNIPLDIPIDVLVTWRELAGDGRLARALEACEENGWEALPLAATELTRLFPELWATQRAAEDWAGNNPLNPNISIIRLGGLFTFTDPGGDGGSGPGGWSDTGLIRVWHSPPCWGSPPRTSCCDRAPGESRPLRPVRPPGPAPPGTPTPIRRWRRSPITPRQTFLLETTSKGVSVRGENQNPHRSPRPRGGVPRGRGSGPRSPAFLTAV